MRLVERRIAEQPSFVFPDAKLMDPTMPSAVRVGAFLAYSPKAFVANDEMVCLETNVSLFLL